MKDRIRKIASLFVLLAMTFHCAGIAPVFAASVQTEEETGRNSYEFLKAVGALDETLEYTDEGDVSRALFVKLALNALGIYFDSQEYTETIFNDVTETTEYASYIGAAYELGYILGENNANFGPQEPITLLQSIMILSRMLGYSGPAEDQGGYPYGYVSLASRYGVLSGIALSNDDTLNMDNAMRLMENAVNADLLQYEVLEGGRYRLVHEKGVTILTKYQQVYSAEGVITANEYTDLMARQSPVGKNYVAMDDLVFDCGDTDVSDYIGYKLSVYYDGSNGAGETPKILYAKVHKENSAYTFDVRDITVNRGKVEYTQEDGKTKKYSVDRYASFLLNGKLAALSLEDVTTVEKGTIKLICNDGDDIADVVVVYDYNTYVVSGVSSVTNIVTAKGGASLSLEEEDFSIRVVKDGVNIGIDQIKVDDTLLVAESEGPGLNVKTILVSDTVLEGEISEADEDSILVNSVRYKTDRVGQFTQSVGKQYKIYIDALGYAVYAQQQSDLVYGYLYAMESTGIGEEVECKIFTENNRWVKLAFADRVKFNGAYQRAKAVYESLGESWEMYRQLIRYSVNEDNDVALIDTAQSIPIGSQEENAAIRDNAFRMTYSSSLQYRSASRTFDGKVAISSDTKIFVVPPDFNEEDFEVITTGDLVQDRRYTFEAYDTSETLNAGAVVISSNDKAATSATNFMIVRDIVRVLDAAGNSVPGIKSYFLGYQITFPVKISEELSEETVQGLKRGDILQATMDKDGNVVSILKHEPDSDHYYQYNSFYNALTVIGGDVVTCDYQNNTLRINYGPELTGVIMLNSPKVYIYETKKDICTTGTINDIVSGDIILAKMRYIQCNEMIIIRE